MNTEQVVKVTTKKKGRPPKSRHIMMGKVIKMSVKQLYDELRDKSISRKDKIPIALALVKSQMGIDAKEAMFDRHIDLYLDIRNQARELISQQTIDITPHGDQDGTPD